MAYKASKWEGAKYHRKIGFFCIFEVKEADEFTKTVEVIIAYGVNEATEVVRFTLGTWIQ